MGEKISEKRKLTFDGPLTLGQVDTINNALSDIYLNQRVPRDAAVKIDARAAMTIVTVKWEDDSGKRA